jgi:hypothetical protein
MVGGKQETRMAKIQFYRQEPGDIGIEDSFHSDMARKALLGYFNNPNIAAVQRPHHARVITDDEIRTIFTIIATGPYTVARV